MSPIGGSTYNLNTLVGSGSGQTFSISSGGAYVNGFFAGANASHAGLTYKFNSVVGEVRGRPRSSADAGARRPASRSTIAGPSARLFFG